MANVPIELIAILFLGLPVTVFTIGVLFLEENDTTSDQSWRLGKNDPFRYVAYDSDGHIRPWFRPIVFVCGIIFMIGLFIVVTGYSP